MSLSAEQKKSIVTKYQRASNDTGSPEVQVALLSEKITRLSSHLKENTKDNHSRYGLLRMVGERRILLDYLKTIDFARYNILIKSLKLRK